MNLRPRRFARACIRAALALAGASLLFGCARSKSWIERRRDAFVAIAALVNEPIKGLQPYHVRIMPSGGSVRLIDTQLDACFGASPRVELIERAALPADDQGKPIPAAEGLTRAASSFRSGLDECKAGPAKAKADVNLSESSLCKEMNVRQDVDAALASRLLEAISGASLGSRASVVSA